MVGVGVGLDIREPKGTMNNLIITVLSAIHVTCRVRGDHGAGRNDLREGQEGGS